PRLAAHEAPDLVERRTPSLGHLARGDQPANRSKETGFGGLDDDAHARFLLPIARLKARPRWSFRRPALPELPSVRPGIAPTTAPRPPRPPTEPPTCHPPRHAHHPRLPPPPLPRPPPPVHRRQRQPARLPGALPGNHRRTRASGESPDRHQRSRCARHGRRERR